jgi:hypothetical protein
LIHSERATFAEAFYSNPKEVKMQLKGIIAGASIIFVASMAMAESTPKTVDLGKLHESFEEAGYSSLELMDATKQIMISGVVLDVTQSFNGNSILKVGVRAHGQELARLTPADDAQENKLKAMQAGAKFKAICDLAFSSGTQYMSFEECAFK